MSGPREDSCNRTRSELARLLSESPDFDLVRAALCVALDEYPLLDVDAQRAQVARIAEEGAARAALLSNPFARVDALRSYLFEELGFRGNVEAYDDPRNSYLNEVIARRRGIPLTLSILFLDVARRAGFEALGVGLPGHFVVRVSDGSRTIFVDPFHGGVVITEEDCRRLVARSTGRSSLFRREQLDGMSARSMLARLLLNLKQVHLGARDYSRALAVVETLHVVRPDDAREIRDRGLLKAHLGLPGDAIADLETYLSLVPVAPDATSVKSRLAWLRRRLSDTN